MIVQSVDFGPHGVSRPDLDDRSVYIAHEQPDFFIHVFVPLFKDKIVLIKTDAKDNLEERMLKVQKNRDFKRENRIGKI